MITNTYSLINEAYKTDLNNNKITNEKNILNSIYYKLNDIVPINSYTVLTDVSISYPAAQITSIQNLSGKIYLTDPKSQYVYSIPESNESTPTIFESLSTGISIPEYITYSLAKSSLFLYDLNKGLLSVSQNGSLSPIISPIQGSDITAIQAYAGNIYLLDSKTGSMYEANTSTLSYSKLFSSSKLKEASSFAIDGNIFAVSKNGSILRFYANTLTPFSVSNSNYMEYSLNNVSFIYDNQYINDLYVLNPSHNRIVVLQKPSAGATNTVDYSFVKQYVYFGKSNIFKNMDAMALSSSGNTIYILSGSKVVKINI